MSDVRKTGVLNDKNSSQRMQNQHSHQANQTTHFEQSERANDIFSQDVKARTAMARNGENLDVLVHDTCPMVRREVALRGYQLETLSKDESSLVREAVARCGYDTSSAVRDNSAIVRQAVGKPIDTVNKHSDSVFKAEQKLNTAQAKYDKLGVEKSVHRVRMYSEYDSASNSNKVHVALDTTKMSREDFAKHKQDNRGLLHKIDSHFQNQNVGLMYARVQKPLRLDENGKRHLQSPITMHSLNTPHFVQNAGKAVWDKALKTEAGLFRYGDTAKRLLVDPTSQAAKVAILNKLNEAGRDNLGVDVMQKGSRATLTVVRGVLNYRKDMLAYKPTRLENKRDKAALNLDKKKMRAANAHHKELFKASKERSMAFGLNPKAKKDKIAVKNSWSKVFDSSDGKNYIKAPEKARLDKNAMPKEQFKHEKQMNKLERKQFKYDKKAYKTVKVKQRYFNSATGRFQTKTVKMVDKSRLKKPKARKPNSLAARPALAGIGTLRNKAFNAMSQSDNTAVQAAGKGASYAFSEFSRSYQASLKRKDKLYEKRVNKARMKAEKTGAKLEVEKNKNPFSENSSKKKNKKKAQKKQLQKKRNSQMFKENLKKAAKKAKDEVAKKAADFIAGKGKFVALGVLAMIMIMMVPMILSMFLGGGGSSIIGGSAALSVYPVDNKILTDTLLAYNDELEKFYTYCEEYVKTLDDEQGYEVDIPNNVYGSLSIYFQGAKGSLRYDIFKMASYLSAKYRNDWSSAEAECRSMITTLYELDCKKENGDEIENKQTQTISRTDENGNSTSSTITITNVIRNYYIYPKEDVSLDQYIQEQLSNMGEPIEKEDGKTEYELHYDYLMEAYGGHQKIGTPLPDFKDWTTSAKTSIYEHIPPSQAETIDNCIGIACGSGKKVTAGGDGVVTSIGDGSITVTYGDDFVVTYYGNVSSTDLELNSVVAYGDLLFKTSDGAGDSPYNLQISVYDNSVGSYVNPAFVMEGYEGQMEDNRRRQEEELEQETEE